MKTIYSLAMGLLMVWGINAQTFKKVNGAAMDICTDKQGNVFVVSTIKQVLKFDVGQSKFKIHAVAKGSAEVVAGANKDTYVIARGKTHQTSSRGTNAFYNVSAPTLNDIYVDTKNNLWGINSAKRIVHKGPKGWQVFQLAGANNKKLALNNSGRVFALKANNAIYEYYNGRARKLPGAATDIAYDHKQNKLYVLGISKRFFVWNPGRNNWDLVKNTRNDFKSIAAHDGKLWGTTTRNAIYTTTNVNPTTSKSLGGKKLKITLTKVECLKNGDGGNNPDDYFLEFFTTLEVANKDIPLRNKEYLRLGTEIEEYGQNKNLYIDYRHAILRGEIVHDYTWYLGTEENRKLWDKRQLHVLPRKMVKINNSGHFTLSENNRIKESNSQFYISAALSEITYRKQLFLKAPGTEVTKIFGEKKKINLPLALDYLSKTKNKGDFSTSKSPYYRMGTGYTGLTLDEDAGGHRSMSGYFYGLSREDKDKTRVTREAKVHFTIELID